MKKIFALVFLPLRLIIYLIRRFFILLSQGTHLYITIPSEFAESEKSFLIKKLQGEQDLPFLTDFLEILELASHSKKLKQITLEIPKLRFGFSELYSIYVHLLKLKNQNIVLNGFSNEGDLKSLILLSLCDKRYSSPYGEFHSILPSVDAFFFADMAKKWNIQIDVFPSGAYKSFGETFTRKSFSKEARSNLNDIIQDSKNEILDMIGKFFQIHEKLLQEPILPSEKLKSIGFFHGLYNLESFRKNFNHPKFLNGSDTPKTKEFSEWVLFGEEKIRNFHILGDNRPTIAILPLKGQILEGKTEEEEPKIGTITYNSIIKTIQKLKDDKKIKAVVLEIESPGGSAQESEKIYQALKDLDQEKPVYAFLSNVCASGGYYLACAARKIFTTPSSIVGSIGTLFLRVNLEGLYKKLGITKDQIGFYPYREIFSEYGKLSANSIQFIKKEIQRVDGIFRSRVKEARKLSDQELDSVAGGRVFTGRKFTEKKLSDGVASLFETLQELSKNEFKGKPFRFVYLAPNYNLKLALSDKLPLQSGFYYLWLDGISIFK